MRPKVQERIMKLFKLKKSKFKIFLGFLVILAIIAGGFYLSKRTEAANNCWTGGGSDANWSTAANWKNGALGATDIAEFDSVTDCPIGTYPNANKASTIDSGFSTTIAGVSVVSYSGVITHSSGVTLTVTGSVTFLASTYTASADTSAISMTGTGTLTTGGNSIGNFTVNGSGITVTLGDTFTALDATQTTTLTQGTLTTGNQTITWGIFSSPNGSTRTITLGSSNITMTGTGTVWNSASTITITAHTSTITCSGAGATFQGNGGQIYRNLVFTGSGNATIANSFSLTNVTRTGTASIGDALTFSGTAPSISGSLTVNGNGTNPSYRLLVKAGTLGTQITITNTGATINAQYADFKDIKFTTSVDLSAITGSSGDAGGNSGITFTTSANKYWVGNGGNWSNPTNHWATSSGGSPGANNLPLPQDDVYFDANSFSSGSQTVTSDVSRLGRSINWTGAANSPTWTFTVSNTFYGSLTLISGMTLTTNNFPPTFEQRGNYTITSAGKTFSNSVVFQPAGGKITLLDNFKTDTNITFFNANNITSNGTFDANGFNVTCATFASNNNAARTVTMGSGTWTLTGTGNVLNLTTTTNLTLNANTSTIAITNTSSSTKTFIGGGLTYNNLSITGTGSGAVIFTGSNTFNTMTIGTPKTVQFTAGTTQTITSLVAVGTSSNKVTLQSSTSSSQWNINAKGPNDITNVIVSDSNACSGHTIIANNSTNNGNNSCWDFITTTTTKNPTFILKGVKIQQGVSIKGT